MRAVLTRLALALTVLLSGCMAPRGGGLSGGGVVPLDQASPGLAEALAHYSQALIDEATPGGADNSLLHWRSAVAADPTNLALRLKLGSLLLTRREPAEAIPVLEAGRDLAPRSADMRLLLGSAYQLTGKLRPAAREFRALITLAPDHPDGYVRLAALELGRGERDRALAVLDEGMPHRGAALAVLQFCENMGRLYVASRQFKDAIACFERVQARLPENTAIREVLARCYALTGDRDKAIAGLQDVLRRDPRNGQVAYYLGELYEEADDIQRAALYFDKATHLDPADASPFLRLAFLQLARDRAGAMATLQRALKAVPDDPAVYAYIGLIHSRDHDYEKAVDAFAKAEALTAKSGDKRLQPQFYFWYGSACEQAGRFEQAEKLLEACIQADPQAEEALNYLAYMWADRGINLEKALAYVQRALKLNPQDGAYVDTLGWIQFKRGEYAAALEALEEAMNLTPNDPTITGHLGDALKAAGQAREARRYWLQSLRLKPDQPALRAKLVEQGVDVDAELRKSK